MSIALVFLLLSATIGGFIVYKAVGITRRLTGGPQQKDPGAQPTHGEEQPSENSPDLEAKQQEKDKSVKSDRKLSDMVEQGIACGIEEWSVTAPKNIELFSSLDCLSRAESGLSEIEMDNRQLADEQFFGFNLVIRSNCAYLTYNNQVVVSIKESKIVREGSSCESTDNIVRYTTTTFPPSLSPGMVAADVQQILDATAQIKRLKGDPRGVTEAMAEIFSSRENVRKLRRNIVPQIQAKQTRGKSQKFNRSTRRAVAS